MAAPRPRQIRPLALIGGAIALVAAATAMKSCRPVDDHRRYTVEQLVDQAESALEALEKQGRKRVRRPVPFDAVLRPVDWLVAKSRDALRDAAAAREAGDPKAMEEGFGLALRSGRAARDIARRGRDLAFRLTNPNNPTVFRFPEQQAEASLQIATVLWARMGIRYGRTDDRFDAAPPAAEIEAVLAEIELGMAASARNKELCFLEGEVKAVKGDFRGAADAYRRATQLDADFGMAYAGLGKAAIETGDFAAAEKAFRDQITVGRRDLAAGRGAETLLYGLYNAAVYHHNVAAGFDEKSPATDEDRRQARVHRAQALALYGEFLRTPGAEEDPAALATARDAAAFLQRFADEP